MIQELHIYKDISMPTMEKTLQNWRELGNDYDSFVMAIIKNDTIIESPY